MPPRRSASSPTTPEAATGSGCLEAVDKVRRDTATPRLLPSPEEDDACGRCGGGAAGNERGNRLPLRPPSKKETLTDAVLESMAVLVGGAAPTSAVPAAHSVSVGGRTSVASAVAPAGGDGPNKMPPTPDQQHWNTQSSFLKPCLPPRSPAGDGIGPSSPPPPLSPPPLPPPPTASDVMTTGTKARQASESSPSSTTTKEEPRKGTVGDHHRVGKGGESAQVDTDNRRKALVGGVLTLLGEMFDDEWQGEWGWWPKVDGGDHDGRVLNTGDQREEAPAEEGSKSRVWVSGGLAKDAACCCSTLEVLHLVWAKSVAAWGALCSAPVHHLTPLQEQRDPLGLSLRSSMAHEFGGKGRNDNLRRA